MEVKKYIEETKMIDLLIECKEASIESLKNISDKVLYIIGDPVDDKKFNKGTSGIRTAMKVISLQRDMLKEMDRLYERKLKLNRMVCENEELNKFA